MEVAADGRPGFGRGFSSLRIYNYRLYWFGQLVSLTGTWMQRLAQAWLVLKLTNSPFALGLVTTLQFLPLTLFALYGGVIADRFPKHKLLIVTQSIAAVQAIVLAALTSAGAITIWEIYVLAIVLGLSNAFDNPTRQSFPVELVGRDEVPNAVALNSTLFNTSRIVGPALAGVAIATIGVAGCFWLNAVSFLAVIGGLLAMKPSQFFAVPARQRGSTVKLLRGGISYALRTPEVFVLLILLLFLGTFGYNFNVLLPLLARFTLKTSSLGYGFLFAGLGVGSLVAALGLAYTRSYTLRTVLIGGTAFVIMLALLGLSRIYPISLTLLTLVGVFSIMFSAATQTRLQVIVPDEYRGRVMSLYTLLFAGTTPIGSQFIGDISQRWNVQIAIEAACALLAIGLVLAWFYLRHRRTIDHAAGELAVGRPDAARTAPNAERSPAASD
jgi:MFS family permease